MTARAGRWELVGYESDPVPGTPSEVWTEAYHYSQVAQTIEDQIDWLNRLSDPDDRLEGQYVDGLNDNCEDLADDLGKIEGRFRTTREQLDRLHDAMLTARSETATALDNAETAWAKIPEEERAANSSTFLPATDPDLAAARSKAHSAVGTFDEIADDVAKKIKDASDDDMKDSRWDKFKDWVSGFADVLDALCDLAGILAAIIMVVCIFIPGPGWLVALALGAALFALGGHTLLAATGNGSWLDVAFDVVALLTMGVGGRLLKLASGARGTVLTTQGTRAGTQASQAVINRGLFNGGRGILGNVHRFYRLHRAPWQARAATAYDDAFNQWALRTLPEGTRTSRLLALGDDALASHLREVQLLTRELGPEAVSSYTNVVRNSAIMNATSAATDFGETLMNPKIGPHMEAWDFGPRATLSDALTFSLPDIVMEPVVDNVVDGPVNNPVPGVR